MLQAAEEREKHIAKELPDAKEKVRGLSWHEALELWHTIFANPKIRYRYETIRPSHFTKPTGRRYPKSFCLWADFHGLHRSAFTTICRELAKPEAISFESRQFYQTDARKIM